MKLALLSIVLVAGCTTEDDSWSLPDPGPPPVPWDLVKTRAMAGELPVLGMDADGEGGLWIAYARNTGDAPAVDNVRLVHLDAAGDKIAEHRYSDEDPRIVGLAVSADAIWLNIAPGLDEQDYLQEVDPATGAFLDRMPIEQGTHDLAIDHAKNEMLLSSYYGRVIALDLATGVETWRFQVENVEPGYASLQRAIAITDDGHLWIGAVGVDRFEVFDASHQHVASYTTDVTVYHFTTAYGVHLAWDDQIIAATENQFSWLVKRGAP